MTQRKLTPRGRERRNQVMLRAAELFAEKGYHPTSVSDIVTSLGVGKGVFYWYFENKEELFAEILRAAHTDLRRRQRVAIGDEPDPLRRIEAGIRETMRWFHEHRDSFSLLLFAATDERFAPVLRRNQEVAIDDTVRHLKDAIVAGQIPDQDPQTLARAVIGVLEKLAHSCLIERDEPLDTTSDAAVAFCLHGLSGPR